MKTIILFFGILLLSIFLVSANVSHKMEIEEGRKLVESNVVCDKLNDNQLEAIGEYYMEQMHPGEAHDAMHKMMGIEEGTNEHEQFHVNIAQMMYCGNGTTGYGMMGSGDMMKIMPMMNMMRWQNPTQINMVRRMTGSSGYGFGYWNFLNLLYLILIIGLIILVFLGIIKLWRNLYHKKDKK